MQGTMIAETLSFLNGLWREETMTVATCRVERLCASPVTSEM